MARQFWCLSGGSIWWLGDGEVQCCGSLHAVQRDCSLVFWGGNGMFLPRRLCSLVGGFLLLFFCFFYILDHYSYQYDSHLVVVRPEYPIQKAPQDRPWPRSLPLSRPFLNNTNRGNATAFSEDRKRMPCKKMYWRCNSTVPTDPEPPPEVLQELEAVGGSDPSSSPILDAPLWTQYADRGYTVLGE